MATKLRSLNRIPDKGEAETSSWQHYMCLCALADSSVAQGCSARHKGYRDNEWIFIKCSKYALITLIGLLCFQLWQNFISVQVTFASGLVSTGKEKVKLCWTGQKRPLMLQSCSFFNLLLAGLKALLVPLVNSKERFRRHEMLENDKEKQQARRKEVLILLLIINRPNSERFQFGSAVQAIFFLTLFVVYQFILICGVWLYIVLYSDWLMPNKEYCPKDLHSNVTRRDRTCTKLKSAVRWKFWI